MAIVNLHKRKDNNEVFYIGISNSNERAYVTRKKISDSIKLYYQRKKNL